MENFLYLDLNRACRQKDRSKIRYYGSYAAAFSYIINYANQYSQDKLSGLTTLYRGIKLEEHDIDTFERGKTINLQGYTSSSTDIDTAIRFAICDVGDKVPCIF